MPKTARALMQLPPATSAAIEKLGADLAVARLHRKELLKARAKAYAQSRATSNRTKTLNQAELLIF